MGLRVGGHRRLRGAASRMASMRPSPDVRVAGAVGGPLTVIVTWRLSDLSTRAARISPPQQGAATGRGAEALVRAVVPWQPRVGVFLADAGESKTYARPLRTAPSNRTATGRVVGQAGGRCHRFSRARSQQALSRPNPVRTPLAFAGRVTIMLERAPQVGRRGTIGDRGFPHRARGEEVAGAQGPGAAGICTSPRPPAHGST
jgi:hypothetical protein